MLWPKPLLESLVDSTTVYHGDVPPDAALPYVTVARYPEEVCVCVHTWNETGEPHPCREIADEATRHENESLHLSDFAHLEPAEVDVIVLHAIVSAKAKVAVAQIVHDLLALDWPLVLTQSGCADESSPDVWYGMSCPLLPGLFIAGVLNDSCGPSRAHAQYLLVELFERYIAADQWRELIEVRKGLRAPFEYDHSIEAPPEHACSWCDTCGDCHGCVPLDGQTHWVSAKSDSPLAHTI